MTCTLVLDGHLSVGGPGCGCSDSDSSMTSRGLELGCNSSSFQAIKSTDCAVQITTSGNPGDAWTELPVTLGKYELLSLKSQGAIKVRLGAAPAELAGDTVVYPVTTIDTDLFAFTVDDLPVSLNFVGASLTVQQVAAQINAGAIADGLTFLPAFVESGQLKLRGEATGKDSQIVITTGLADIGFATSDLAEGAGEDLDVRGIFLLQFGTEGPERIQISGNTKVEILAAGTP